MRHVDGGAHRVDGEQRRADDAERHEPPALEPLARSASGRSRSGTRTTAGPRSASGRRRARSRPSHPCSSPARPMYSVRPPIHSSPLRLLRTLSGLSSHVCSNSRCTARVKLSSATRKNTNPTRPRLVLDAGRREDVVDRLRAAARQPIAVDDAVGGVLPAEARRDRARDDRQRDDRGQRARRERHRAVEAHHLLEAADHPQHELRPQPERQGADDPLTIDLDGRHAGWSSSGVSRDITPSG